MSVNEYTNIIWARGMVWPFASYDSFLKALLKANQAAPNQPTRNRRMANVLRRANASRLSPNNKARLHRNASRLRGARASVAARKQQANRQANQLVRQAQAEVARERDLRNRLALLQLARLPSPPRTRR